MLIIGILAAVAVPQYKKAVYKSRYASLKHLADALAKAEEIYFLENGKYTDYRDKLSIEMGGGRKDSGHVNNYIWDWGQCFVQSAGVVACNNSKTNMGILIYLAHHATAPGSKHCRIFGTTDATDFRNQICKVETGAAQGHTNTADNNIFWAYQ